MFTILVAVLYVIFCLLILTNGKTFIPVFLAYIFIAEDLLTYFQIDFPKYFVSLTEVVYIFILLRMYVDNKKTVNKEFIEKVILLFLLFNAISLIISYSNMRIDDSEFTKSIVRNMEPVIFIFVGYIYVKFYDIESFMKTFLATFVFFVIWRVMFSY